MQTNVTGGGDIEVQCVNAMRFMLAFRVHKIYSEAVMVVEFPEFLKQGEHSPDVIIVGSGLAAFAAAYTLESRGIPCTLFESGAGPGQKEWKITSETIAMADYGVSESYAQLHIRREPGGASSVWGGWCTTLRGFNFSRKDLAGYPAWPIDKNELLPFYRKAIDWLQIDGGERALADDVLISEKTQLVAKPFGFSPPTRYETTLKEHVAASTLIKLVTNATVDSFEAKNGKVESLVFKTPEGLKKIKCSKEVILAGGAVGNARVLARSKKSLQLADKTAAFVGNYFYEHPHCYSIGKVLFAPETAALIDKQEYWSRTFVSIAPTTQYLEKHGLTDFNFQLVKFYADRLTPSELEVANNYRAIHGVEPQFYQCILGMEQMAVASNSVLDADVVAGKNDGHLKLDLDPQTTIVNAAKKWLATQCMQIWSEPEKPAPVQAVGHLHGTTRMAANKDEGVVDKNCRVFGVENLYVAGSSVFPTGGFSNPTMTIVALAKRLGEHVQGGV